MTKHDLTEHDIDALNRACESLQYLIVGTGHSGTSWAAQVLSTCNLRSSHEGIFQDKPRFEPGFHWEAESSCRAVPYLSLLPEKVIVLHLIRHPLDVIRSMAHISRDLQGAWAWTAKDWIQHHLQMKLPTHDMIPYLMAFYCAWTDKIDTSPRVKYRVQIENGQEAICEALNLKTYKYVERTGRRKCPDAPVIRWNDLPDEPYREVLYNKALKYGYRYPYTTHHKPPSWA